MVLRVERVSSGRFLVLRLSGRIQSEQVEELKAQLESSTQKVMLDLAEVNLVDQEAVSFLASSEANGVELCECSPYIREWITRSSVGLRRER